MYADGHEIAERSLEVPISEVYDVVREEQSRALPLLTEMEQHQIAAWNATQQDYPRDAYVPQLVARQPAAPPRQCRWRPEISPAHTRVVTPDPITNPTSP